MKIWKKIKKSARTRMDSLRSKRTEEEVQKDRESARTGMDSLRSIRTEKEVQKDRESATTRMQRLRGNYETDTGFERICCCCLEFKSKGQCTTNINKLNNEMVKKCCYKSNVSLNIDGKFYVCQDCGKTIKAKKQPLKSQRDLFQMTNFPGTFRTKVKDSITHPRNVKNMDEVINLNKLEQFLLKLVLPFIRVAHCQSWQGQLQVRGNLILISSDVTHSMSKILPRPQDILPVSFKRKLTYDGHYLAEFIDRKKVGLYFTWLKQNNPHFENIDELKAFENELEQFEKELQLDAMKVEELSVPSYEVHENVNQDVDDEFVFDEQYINDDDDGDEINNDPSENNKLRQQFSTVMCNKYEEDLEAGTVVNQLASLIVHLEDKKNIPNPMCEDDGEFNDILADEIDDFNPDSNELTDEIEDELTDKIEEEEHVLKDMSDAQTYPSTSKRSEVKGLSEKDATRVAELSYQQKKKLMETLDVINLAPGEKGQFQNWKEDIYIEEKAFPHLFPYGHGGYLSSVMSTGTNMGFSVYCRNRLMSADSKFRDDHIYIFFLFLVKELIELKRCRATYFRQARKTPGLTVGSISKLRYDSLERYSRTFSVFKKMRGTAMYFEAAKKNLMATLRQNGPPTVFLTMSAAEYHWEGLLRSVYETVNGEYLTNEKLAELSAKDRNKLLTDNVVQTTLHFQKRIEKIMRKLMVSGYLESGCEENGKVNGSYFYRIEFQARGAPHIHALLWLKDKDGNSPLKIVSSDDDLEDTLRNIVDFHDKIICCKALEPDNDDLTEVEKDIARYQWHGCGFTCHKKKKTANIHADEGLGINEPRNSGLELINIPVCRFNFPKFPLDKTEVVLGFKKDEDVEVIKSSRKDYTHIRKYLIRKTYVPECKKLKDSPEWAKLKQFTFEEFLIDVGMYSECSSNLTSDEQFIQARNRYMRALRASVRGLASIIPKRDLRDIFTNNYNMIIMKIQKANHDIQICIDPYAVAQYIIGYLSKNESGLSLLCKKIEEQFPNLSEIERINKLAYILDKHREVSYQEVIWRLKGLPMCKFSVRVKYINVSHPDHRDGLLRRDVDDLDDDDANIFYPSPHQYYEKRKKNKSISIEGKPVLLANICLADWLSYCDYFPSGTAKYSEFELQDDMGMFKLRTECAVLRYYLPVDDEMELARALCILFLPFNNEMENIHKKDPIAVLAKNANTIQINREKYEKNKHINDMIKRIEKDREKQMEYESDDEGDDFDEDETTALVDRQEIESKFDREQAKKSFSKVNKTELFLDPVEMRKQITSLNRQQRRIFDDVIEKVSDTDVDEKPFYLYIAGEAGTGKSHVLKLLIYAVRELKIKSGLELDKPTVIVMAPTANAAYVIKGKTIESALRINIGRGMGYKKPPGDKLSNMSFEYSDVSMLFIDEISMVGTNKFAAVNYQLQSIAGGSQIDKFMGSRSCIVAGDFHQLPPVRDPMIFFKSTIDRRSSVAPSHWNENFSIYYLTQKMRCPDDIAFAELCDRVGKNAITLDDEKYLQQRVIEHEILAENSNENFTSGKIAIIVTMNDRREEINLEKVRKLLPGPEYICLSSDSIDNTRSFVPHEETISVHVKHGMMRNLILREKAPVMFTVNHRTARFKEDGLVNGAKGYIDHIQLDDGAVKVIWVVFNNKDVGKNCYRREMFKHWPEDWRQFISKDALPVLPTAKPFQVSQSGNQFLRYQFPLTLAYAMTAHKCQGSTLEEVIVDFRPNKNNKQFIDFGSFYTAITRVTNGNCLFLRDFNRKYVKTHPQVEHEIETMKVRRPYKMKKLYNNEPVFTAENVKVGYLNINDLMQSFHGEYLNGDYNLLDLDLLAIAETKLTKNITNEQLADVLSNWQIIDRFDIEDGQSHMGLLLLGSKNLSSIPVTSQFYNLNLSSKVQGVSCTFNGSTFTFVYCNNTPTNIAVNFIEQNTRSSDYLLADLNLDARVVEQDRKLKQICGECKVILLKEITHPQNNNQLDHILGKEKVGVKTYVTTFRNFIADHKTIVLRESKPGAQYIIDQRLEGTHLAK